MKLQTPVDAGRCPVPVTYEDKITVLGSCFAAEMGSRMEGAGFDVCVNPFGTLFNPVSVCNSISRLASGIPFREKDCVEIGAGDRRICSFSHHTSFARPGAEEFLAHANGVLAEASAFWKESGKVIITLGTAWVFRHVESGEIVSNCLKRPAAEFSRERLSVDQIVALLFATVRSYPDKQFIFTVSPVRHLGDGAHGNSLSKATLLLAVDKVCEAFPGRAAYFPSYEILLDELRDYRFYAEDMVHPSAQAADYIFERFMEAALPLSEKDRLEENRRALLASRHRSR